MTHLDELRRLTDATLIAAMPAGLDSLIRRLFNDGTPPTRILAAVRRSAGKRSGVVLQVEALLERLVSERNISKN